LAYVEEKKLRFTLMSGPEALQNENIIRLFEAIKGRAATPAEIDEMQAQRERRLLPNSRNGRPASGPLGTGIGFVLGGVTSPGPNKPH
jgi:hypothetical protein